MSIQKKIKELKILFDSDYNNIQSKKIDEESIYNKFLGRKGLINTLYPLLSRVKAKEKSEFGKKINDFKLSLISKLENYNSKEKFNFMVLIF